MERNWNKEKRKRDRKKVQTYIEEKVKKRGWGRETSENQ
jgi:hypothetical protein